MNFFWNVLIPAQVGAAAGTPPAAVQSFLKASGPSLELGAGVGAAALTAGQTYRLLVSGSLSGFAGGPAAATAEVPLEFALEPAVAVIAGGDRTVGRTASVTLDASGSVDPNACTAFAFGALAPPPAGCSGGNSGLSFAWACTAGPAGAASSALEPCRYTNGSLLALPATSLITLEMVELDLAIAYPADVVITVAVAGSTGAPAGTSSANVRVLDAVAVAAAQLDTVYANAEGVAYIAQYLGGENSAATMGSATYLWSVSPPAGSPLNTSDVDAFPTGTNGQTFILRINTAWARTTLARGIAYQVTVTVTPPVSGNHGVAPATLWADFTPAFGPTKGTCATVGITKAEEFVAPLIVDCMGWVSEDLPIGYSFTAESAIAATTQNSDNAAMWTPLGFVSR